MSTDTLAPETRAELERLCAEHAGAPAIRELSSAHADRVRRLLAESAQPIADWTSGDDAPIDTTVLVTIEDGDGDRSVRSGWGQDSGRTPIAVDGGLDEDERVVAWRRAPEPADGAGR